MTGCPALLHLPWFGECDARSPAFFFGFFGRLLFFGCELRLVGFRRALLVVFTHGNLLRVGVAELGASLSAYHTPDRAPRKALAPVAATISGAIKRQR